MSLHLKPGTAFVDYHARARAVAPEAFDASSLRNLIGGEWVSGGTTRPHVVPVDGSQIIGAPIISSDEAHRAMALAVKQNAEWSKTPLDERMRRVTKAVALLREQREVIAGLLMWEIGKPWKLACDDIDRCLDGVEWYLTQIERQLKDRVPLGGPVSNIASWNYPLSVLVHAELVQLLAGNAVVAKTPTQGGFHALTLAHAMMARADLPAT